MKIILSIISTLMVSGLVKAEVVFSPASDASAGIQQIRAQFPESMKKTDNPFVVTCDPAMGGNGHWSDNNTTWVYNLALKKDQWGDNLPLPGGATCKISQTQALESNSGAKYKIGSLTHEFVVSGPNVVDVLLLPGFNNSLREVEPVFMVVFDGDVDTQTLLNSNESYLWYSAQDGLPSEKIPLTALPSDKVTEIFKAYGDYALDYRNLTPTSKNWALVTTQKNLVPGAKINLTVAGVVSSFSSKAIVTPHNVALTVRDAFKANVDCSRQDVGSPFCMPEGEISVQLNAQVNWKEAKDVYIEYVPQGSTDGKTIKTYPSDQNVAVNWLSYAAYGLNIPITDDAKVSSLDFSSVKVAPETTAKVVFPQSLVDVDQRKLANNSFNLSFGSFSEIISFPENLTIMEKNVTGNSALPVSIMNLNQKIKVLKTGVDKKEWLPIIGMTRIIDVIVAYDSVRSGDEIYKTPLANLGVNFTEEEVRMSGEKNKKTFLSLNYGSNRHPGLYVAEIQSELSQNNRPAYSLTMLTDINVNLKKGREESVAWVTSYSTGSPVAGAKVTVYDCNKQVAVSGSTDLEGLFKFSHNSVSKKCSKSSGSYLLSSDEFFVAATSKNDLGFTHSSYNAENSWAMGSPGVGYFPTELDDKSVFIHSLIGVNLVKPGQTVPVQLTAVMPDLKGFRSVDPGELPLEIKVTSNNSDVSYTFPLTWVNGSAEFSWDIPKSAELGTYSLKIQKAGSSWYSTIGSTIEVADFEPPIMSANVNIEKGPLIQPTELKVSGYIRFANGVGAPDQGDIEVSYYFAPTNLSFGDFETFNFVKGEFDKKDNQVNLGLPTSDTVARVEGLSTNSEGSLELDLAAESLVSGEKVSDLLAKADRPYSFVVRMKYKDQGGQFQTVSTSENIYSAKSYIGTKVTSGPIAEAKLQVVDLGVDGKANTHLPELSLSVKEIKTHVIGEEVFGGFVKNTFETELVDTQWTASCKLNDGVATCSAAGLKAGSYVFVANSKVSDQKTYSQFKVDSDGSLTADGDYYYFDENEKGLSIASDKEFYRGNETAKLSFESPFANCLALVTLERADITESFVDQNACKNGFVKVNINADDAPNIFASVYLVTGRSDNNVSFETLDLGKPSYRLGFANLKIDWENYALDVKVALDKEEYKPRDIATATVEVAPQNGKLTNATVTVFAIEEKILELKDNNTMKILDSLMGLRGHSVQTINTYKMINSAAEVEGQLVAEAAAMGDAKGGPEGGSGSEFEDMQRRLFDALVSWETNVPVVNGQAQVSFRLNDKLTKFKVFAVVKDSGNKFGTGDSAYLSSQEVQTSSNISTVGRIGDEYPAMITIQNNGKEPGEFTVVMDYTFTKADGTTEVKSSKHLASVAKGGSSSIELGQVKIAEGVSAVDYAITVYNENGVIVDSIAPPTQVISPSVPLTVQDEFLAQVEGGSAQFDLSKNKDALPGQGSIDTKVFGSLVSSAEYSIKKSIADDMFADITIEGSLLKALIESDVDNTSAMSEAYAEVLSQVDSKGFIKYYPAASNGSFWATADLIQLIGMKPWAIKLMPTDLKEKLEKSLVSVIDGSVPPKYITVDSNAVIWTAAKVKAANALWNLNPALGATYSVEVLNQLNSEFAKSLKNADLFSKYSVDAVSDMAVLSAYVDAQNEVSKRVFKYINETLRSDKVTSSIIKSEPSFNWWGYSDEIIATAKVVKAQSLIAKSTKASSSENHLDNYVSGLIQANKGKSWYTTKTKAWVLDGLLAFANTFESEQVTGKTSVTSSESSVAANMTWKTPKDSNGVTTEWLNSDAKISVSHKGDGKPWISVVAESAVKLTAPNYQGLKLTKVITNKSNPGATTYKPGDLIQVDITIDSPSTVPHVALFDPIPSGANIISDGWGSYSSAESSYSSYKVYFYSLDSGSVKLSYQYQLNNPGTFELPQTRVEALYERGLFGEVPNDKMLVVK